jgi:carbonic anhydrase/acetyltransferase-like protein (isoleucine patch superfamily)
VPLYLVIITGIPTALAVLPFASARSNGQRAFAVVAAPALFIVAYALTAGLLSRLTKTALIAGRFPRDLGHPVYGPRRLYALCWTAIYYCPPVYHAILAVPTLKRIVFRLFGYRGSLDVTLYPDTWVRDLPILDLGPGAYLSNRSTIGTNMCLISGDVLVAPIRIGANAMVGHLSMLAPGVVLGESVEIGVGAAIGLNVSIGKRSRVGPLVSVHHGATIGIGCDIGVSSYIGLKAVIGDRLTIPAGSVVPPRTVLRTREDVARLAPIRRGDLDNRAAVIDPGDSDMTTSTDENASSWAGSL